MKKRKRKTTPRSIPQNHNFMSVNVKLSKHPLPVTLPPDTQEMHICKGNTEGLNHLRFIHGFISNVDLQDNAYCIHNCCGDPQCSIITFDFKTKTQWDKAILGINQKEPPIILIEPPKSLNLKTYSHLKACPSLQARNVLTTTETENLVGAIMQGTMPLFISKETQTRDKALGKQTTTSILRTLSGDTKWVDVASWNVFLNHA